MRQQRARGGHFELRVKVTLRVQLLLRAVLLPAAVAHAAGCCTWRWGQLGLHRALGVPMGMPKPVHSRRGGQVQVCKSQARPARPSFSIFDMNVQDAADGNQPRMLGTPPLIWPLGTVHLPTQDKIAARVCAVHT